MGWWGWIELGGSKALVGVGCVLVGVALVVFKGARVLEAEPPTLDSLLHPAPYERVADELKDAVEIGITQPYWNRPESFLEALAELTAPRAKPDLQAVIDSAEECDPANPESAAELEKVLKLYQAGGEVPFSEELRPTLGHLVDWARYKVVRARFRSFLRCLALGVCLIAFGLVFVEVSGQVVGAEISTPTEVVLRLTDDGRTSMRNALGCVSQDPPAESMSRGVEEAQVADSAPAQVKSDAVDQEHAHAVFAIGGTWLRPRLQAIGSRCEIGETWIPRPYEFTMAPASR